MVALNPERRTALMMPMYYVVCTEICPVVVYAVVREHRQLKLSVCTFIRYNRHHHHHHR